MTKVWFFILFLFHFSLFALEIDEKLTSRFLKVSRSKKTVLINRGLEDGLVTGDHAKFFLTTGVIARGLVVKASPTRSIWSIYRIVDGGSIFPEKVVNIKISNPVSVTEDPSKSLKAEILPEGSEVLIAGRGDENLLGEEGMLNAEDKKDMKSLNNLGMNGSESEGPGLMINKTFEVFGLIHLNSLSTSVDKGSDSTTAEGVSVSKASTIDWSFGVEKYFDTKGFLGNTSFQALLHSTSNSFESIDGQSVGNSVFEYGVGTSYHFMASPMSYNRLISFVDLKVGIGKVSDSYIDNAINTSELKTYTGSSSFFSFGVGIKYFTKYGLGARAIIDYYRRSESYALESSDSEDDSTAAYTRIATGPRFQFGLGYRW